MKKRFYQIVSLMLSIILLIMPNLTTVLADSTILIHENSELLNESQLFTDSNADKFEATNSDAYKIELMSSESTVWDGTIATSFAGGDGTQDDPYQIANGAQLAYLATIVNQGGGLTIKDKYYALTADIYLNDISYDDWESNAKSWTPIGWHPSPGSFMYNYSYHMKYEFNSHFDGNEYEIYGLYINDSKDGCGLFGSLENAEISNVFIGESYISGKNYVGSIAGIQNWGSKIYNCESHATIEGNNLVGGIIGYDRTGTYEFCNNGGIITGQDSVGGIIGQIGYGYVSVIKSANRGEVYGSTNVGGIVGIARYQGTKGGKINNCFNEAEVSGETNVGGITGKSEFYWSVGYCYNVGNIRCNDIKTSGGIVGCQDVTANSESCYYLNTTASNNIGKGSWSDPDINTRKSEQEMGEEETYLKYDFESIWCFMIGCPYPQLITDDSKYYAKIIVADQLSGNSINDCQVKFGNEDELFWVPLDDDTITGNFIAGTYRSFNKNISITISKDGYKPFQCNSKDLTYSASAILAKNNLIYLTPEDSSNTNTELNEEQRKFILEHVEYAQNRHDAYVSKRGFGNAYWKFDDGSQMILSNLGNWLGNVNDGLDWEFKDIKFSGSYYDLFLSDLFLSMTGLDDSPKIDGMAFSSFKKYYSEIIDNYIIKFKDIDIKKEDLLSPEEREAWNALMNDVNWKDFKKDLEKLFEGGKKEELKESTVDLITFVAGKEFYEKHQEILTNVYNGLDVANEASTYICNAAECIDAFRETTQAYVAVRTIKDANQYFFEVMDKVPEQMEKNYPYRALIFKTQIEKYEEIAFDDEVYFRNCLSELANDVGEFTYSSFVKKYATKVAYGRASEWMNTYVFGNKLHITAGELKVLITAYRMGYAFGNWISGLSEKTKNYTLMYYVAPVEEALENISRNYADVLLENYADNSDIGKSDIYNSACAYDCSYQILTNTNLYLYNCMYNIGAAGKTIEIPEMSFTMQAPPLMSLAMMNVYFWEKHSCHGNTSVISNRYKMTSIQCPVDVYVYDKNNDLILSIVDEEIVKCDPTLIVLINNEKKTIIYPENEKFNIKIMARQAGVMDYSVAEIDDGEIRNIEFYNIPLIENKEYKGAIVSTFDADAKEYELHTDDASISADYDDFNSQNCLNTPSDLHWSGYSAEWEVDAHAVAYKVFLYRNDSLLHEETVTTNMWDATAYLTEAGRYAFSVIAIGDGINYQNSKRSGVSMSLDYTVSEEEPDNPNDVKKPDDGGNSSSQPSANKSYGHSYDSNSEVEVTLYSYPQMTQISEGYSNGKWVLLDKDMHIWTYLLEDGKRACNGWLYISKTGFRRTFVGDWFCFDNNGIMRHGWIQTGDNSWYFCHDDKDGDFGKLQVGWYKDEQDGNIYYFAANSGKMVAGWQQIDSVWYYFADRKDSPKGNWYWDEKSGKWLQHSTTSRSYGSMFRSESTPDGYVVDENGRWIP